jgi:uncharacterized metal-binding protein
MNSTLKNNNIFVTNFALWTILITNTLALVTTIISVFMLFKLTGINEIIINLLTPGKEWLEISGILLGIMLIYLINMSADIISKDIKNIIKKKDERIKALEKILEANNIKAEANNIKAEAK